MTSEKFEGEVKTLKKFFELHCKHKHQNRKDHIRILSYNDKEYQVELNLCDDCKKLIDYSFDRLLDCPHDIKPRCRTCPAPCYDKKEWKSVASLMRYSGMHFGLTKVKNFFKLSK